MPLQGIFPVQVLLFFRLCCQHFPVSQQPWGLVLMGSVLLCAVVRIAAPFCHHPQTWETKFRYFSAHLVLKICTAALKVLGLMCYFYPAYCC